MALRTTVEANQMNVWPPQTHRIPELYPPGCSSLSLSPAPLISADSSDALFLPISSPNHPRPPIKHSNRAIRALLGTPEGNTSSRAHKY